MGVRTVRKVRSIIRHGAETFIIESPKLISQMRAAIEAADCVGLQRIAHAYKGSVSAFSAGAAADLAARLEMIGSKGNISEAEPLIASLETSAGRVCALLNTLMEEKSCAY